MMYSNITSPILVTGATGYIASHLIKILLERDFRVRGTVRSMTNNNKYEFLYNLVPDKKHQLQLVQANLSQKTDWIPAVEGCEYIFHVASPIPPYVPKDEMELIGPAVSGTVNVLEAAVLKGVKKVVITSSSHTMSTGNEHILVSEEDWAIEDKCGAYAKSKLKAEKAAWNLYEENKSKIEMCIVNPSMTLGPVFTKHGNSSEAFVADVITGSFPGIMDVKFGLVDVRDVAEAHYRAMFNEGTNGKRYICSHRGVAIEEIVNLAKKEFERFGYNIKDKHVNAEEVRASGNAVAQRQLGLIGKEIKLNNEKSVKELDLTYIPVEKTIIDMGYSLIKLGIIPSKTIET